MELTDEQLREKYGERYQELLRQIKEKDLILENYRKEHGKMEVFFNVIAGYITPVPPLPVVYKKRKGGSDTVAVMQISDSHMGSVQVSSEIEGFNEFSPEICESRSLEYVNRFVDWVYMHRASYTVNECAVIVTGDMISGDIHEELKVTNAFPSPVKCVRAGELLARQISGLAQHFNKVTVHFISEDNHARLTKKPQAKEAGYNSLNYIVGKLAELQLANHPTVEFNIYPMFEKVIRVSNRQYLISHGHKIMGWMGIPWYSIERKVSRESGARMQLIMEDIGRAKSIGFHKYIFGHWHTPFDSPLYACCGSVSGCDAYDHNAGRYSGPSQSAWMVHPKRGEFDRTNFDL